MPLIAGTGDIAKNKDYVFSLSGFTAPTGATSVWGTGDINSTNAEYVNIGFPNTTEDESVDFESNLRSLSESIENKKYEAFSKVQFVNDAAGENYKAFLAAKELGSTGTIGFAYKGTNIGSFKAKVSNVEGADGGVAELCTAFTPTFTIIEPLGTGTATA